MLVLGSFWQNSKAWNFQGALSDLWPSLEATWRSLESGQQHAAVNELQSFQHKIEKQLQGDAAARLIAAAQAIIDSLSN
jgi:hypothetical protein